MLHHRYTKCKHSHSNQLVRNVFRDSNFYNANKSQTVSNQCKPNPNILQFISNCIKILRKITQTNISSNNYGKIRQKLHLACNSMFHLDSRVSEYEKQKYSFFFVKKAKNKLETAFTTRELLTVNLNPRLQGLGFSLDQCCVNFPIVS